jgi:hypothetical protein
MDFRLKIFSSIYPPCSRYSKTGVYEFESQHLGNNFSTGGVVAFFPVWESVIYLSNSLQHGFGISWVAPGYFRTSGLVGLFLMSLIWFIHWAHSFSSFITKVRGSIFLRFVWFFVNLHWKKQIHWFHSSNSFKQSDTHCVGLFLPQLRSVKITKSFGQGHCFLIFY